MAASLSKCRHVTRRTIESCESRNSDRPRPYAVYLLYIWLFTHLNPRVDAVCTYLRLSKRVLLEFDLDIDASWQLESHKGVNSRGSRVHQINYPAVRADFKVLPRVFVHVRRTQYAKNPVRRIWRQIRQFM